MKNKIIIVIFMIAISNVSFCNLVEVSMVVLLHRPGLSAGTVSRRRPNILDRRRLIEGAHGGTNHVYYCIYSMYSVTEGERVSRSDHGITKKSQQPRMLFIIAHVFFCLVGAVCYQLWGTAAFKKRLKTYLFDHGQ